MAHAKSSTFSGAYIAFHLLSGASGCSEWRNADQEQMVQLRKVRSARAVDLSPGMPPTPTLGYELCVGP
jgi:hypothetical protein